MTAKLHDLETPCLVADRSRIENNAARMREKAHQHGFSLRPHLKTTTSAAVAHIVHGGMTSPACVSTLREADYLHANGFSDNGVFQVAPSPKPKDLEDLFRYEVLKMLKSEGKINNGDILTWQLKGTCVANTSCSLQLDSAEFLCYQFPNYNCKMGRTIYCGLADRGTQFTNLMLF